MKVSVRVVEGRRIRDSEKNSKISHRMNHDAHVSFYCLYGDSYLFMMLESYKLIIHGLEVVFGTFEMIITIFYIEYWYQVPVTQNRIEKSEFLY